ncbi:CPCC family cysteine-rich protein [Actinomadura macrotermitis]|uniref:CPCC family cysteine-rich protein n=1 Tax=Actinomadura macrotermitis TaxID=2585200 RepID=UPI0038B25A35
MSVRPCGVYQDGRTDLRYPCVCCGHLTMEASPDSYQICPVCFRRTMRISCGGRTGRHLPTGSP